MQKCRPGRKKGSQKMFQKEDANKAAVGSRTYSPGGSQKSRTRFRRVINGSPKTGSRRRRAPKPQKAPFRVFSAMFLVCSREVRLAYGHIACCGCRSSDTQVAS
jgi:hypothetical protein